MSLSVNGVNSLGYVYAANPTDTVNGVNASKPINFQAKAKDNQEQDTFDYSQNRELSVKEKQKIIKKARANATGWAILGSVFSTAYYGLRSDRTIAEKYNLDLQKDNDLIKQIKKEQTLWSLTGILPGGGPLIAFIVVNCLNSDNIEID